MSGMARNGLYAAGRVLYTLVLAEAVHLCPGADLVAEAARAGEAAPGRLVPADGA